MKRYIARVSFTCDVEATDPRDAFKNLGYIDGSFISNIRNIRGEVIKENRYAIEPEPTLVPEAPIPIVDRSELSPEDRARLSADAHSEVPNPPERDIPF